MAQSLCNLEVEVGRALGFGAWNLGLGALPAHGKLASGQLQEHTMAKMLFMVIEHFKDGDPVPVYRRFRDHGRLAPEGLTYVASWVDTSFERCYQLMETDDPHLLDQWMAHWSDIVAFEVHPIITSAEAAEKIAPRL